MASFHIMSQGLVCAHFLDNLTEPVMPNSSIGSSVCLGHYTFLPTTVDCWLKFGPRSPAPGERSQETSRLSISNHHVYTVTDKCIRGRV